MGFFDPPSVKDLRKQAEFVGGLHGQAHLGHIGYGDVRDVVNDADWRAKLRAAFVTASAEVGEDKARKAAIKAANLGAESYARLGQGAFAEVLSEAERNVDNMLSG